MSFNSVLTLNVYKNKISQTFRDIQGFLLIKANFGPNVRYFCLCIML